ncbi:hypothetical protein OQA88_787 [Cercophora sp. LCS_1]
MTSIARNVAQGATPIPTTPQKNVARTGGIEHIIDKINRDYGLAIQVPDKTLPPVTQIAMGQQNQEYERWVTICKYVRFLQYQGRGGLEMALHNFVMEANAESEMWVPKQPQDANGFRKARTQGQRLKYETLLKNAIVNTASMLGPVPSASQTPQACGVSDDTSPTGSKRSFTNGSSSPSKRARNAPNIPAPVNLFPPVNTTQFDQVPSRQRMLVDSSATLVASQSTPTPVKRMAAGVNNISFASTSKSSFRAPTVFTDDADAVQNIYTQSTAIDNSPTQRPKGAKYNQANPAAVVGQYYDLTTPVPLDLNRPASRASRVSKTSATTVYHSIADPASSVGPKDGYQHEVVDAEPIGYAPPVTAPEFELKGILKDRMKNIWRKFDCFFLKGKSGALTVFVTASFPRWLHKAPLAVAWEITRIAVHNKVNLDEIDLEYNPAWEKGIETIWADLRRYDERAHPVFNDKGDPVDSRKFKSFPPKSPKEAWVAALGSFETKGNVVVLTASLDWNQASTGPLYIVDMKPLKLDQGCRLTRRFGADRFFEILISSPTSNSAPQWISKIEGAADQIIGWLTQQQHSLVGRQWRAFYTKDAGYRKPVREYSLAPERKPEFKDRVHFFAESGHNFHPAPILRAGQEWIVPANEPTNQRTDFKVSQMLGWLLQIRENGYQPHLKLFSRIQLGLSKTYPVVTFEPDQIAHRSEDILSPARKVMNDGIGRMSRSVARKIRDVLGLQDIPSAVQGRLGSAKGMWLLDVKDMGHDDWIETYPSQRKWECDYADPLTRTLEVRSIASELKSANLNLQLLPVLEACADDKVAMRRAIGYRLTTDLKRQFDEQKKAFDSPLQFRDWLTSVSNVRANRVHHGHVRMLAGMPESKEEVMHLMLNSGFNPRVQRYLQDIAWELQKQKTDLLKTKLNIKVGRSAYVYMVVDFWGILEEDEVHLGFSSKFQPEGENESMTMLSEMDVLVARSPAHFVSDIQRVKAVFKPELHMLKDVIIFPAKGDIPLADKLSGGDYDGDLAWVCWDQDLVGAFRNAEVPQQPDLSKYLKKDKTTFSDIVLTHSQVPNDGMALERATYEMISKSFLFAMQPNFLGICTNYKEKLCYMHNNVASQHAVVLSTLVGQLVDQSKQGITFNEHSWNALRTDLLKTPRMLDDPAYKGNEWRHSQKLPSHIIDYLKFAVAKPAIDQELFTLKKKLETPVEGENPFTAYFYDRDLIYYHDSIAEVAQKSRSTASMLDKLGKAIRALSVEWSKAMAPRKNEEFNYSAKVARLYNEWQAISLESLDVKLDPKVAVLLEHKWMADPVENSGWALLKASLAFKLMYRSPKFVFQMCGRQLCFLKALRTKGGEAGDGHLAIVTPLMYAGLTHDGRFVKQWAARLECDGTEYPEPEDDDGEDREKHGFGGYSDY